MLNRVQQKYLKKYSHQLKPVFQIGKNGESSLQIDAILEYLEIHEIVKVSVLNNAPDTKDFYAQVLENHGMEVVSVVGRIITVYKYSSNEDKKSKLRLP